MNELWHEDFREDLARARADAAASHSDAMNSYGAGYDAGYVEGLRHVWMLLYGEDNEP